jgi:very-long-chain (3R)-3-hydroxyacyl-CoA dehydratase
LPHLAPPAPSTGLTAYLVVYNALSCLAWSTILVLLLWHIFDGQASTPFKTSTTGVAPTAASLAAKVRQVLVQLQLLLARVLPSAIVHEPAVRSPTSSLLAGIQARLRAAGYTSVGPLVKVVQTAAVLEVVHAALGWVRSPVGTTAAQVASRLWSVWAVAEQFPSVRLSSLPRPGRHYSRADPSSLAD